MPKITAKRPIRACYTLFALTWFRFKLTMTGANVYVVGIEAAMGLWLWAKFDLL
ncbi:hypothetical protein IG631_11128 [Alternaria alternata]|nr:hypothetical protein IG631_11128 [Alternaria alternata]